jgi:hypothetical protein
VVNDVVRNSNPMAIVCQNQVTIKLPHSIGGASILRDMGATLATALALFGLFVTRLLFWMAARCCHRLVTCKRRAKEYYEILSTPLEGINAFVVESIASAIVFHFVSYQRWPFVFAVTGLVYASNARLGLLNVSKTCIICVNVAFGVSLLLGDALATSGTLYHGRLLSLGMGLFGCVQLLKVTLLSRHFYGLDVTYSLVTQLCIAYGLEWAVIVLGLEYYPRMTLITLGITGALIVVSKVTLLPIRVRVFVISVLTVVGVGIPYALVLMSWTGSYILGFMVRDTLTPLCVKQIINAVL